MIKRNGRVMMIKRNGELVASIRYSMNFGQCSILAAGRQRGPTAVRVSYHDMLSMQFFLALGACSVLGRLMMIKRNGEWVASILQELWSMLNTCRRQAKKPHGSGLAVLASPLYFTAKLDNYRGNPSRGAGTTSPLPWGLRSFLLCLPAAA